MSAPASANAQLIAAYLDAVVRRDADAVDRYFAPDVVYMVNGTPVPDPAGVLPPISAACHAALPWLGLYRGRAELKAFLAHMHANLDVTAFGPREVISEGNRAAAFGWFRLRARATGRSADIAYAIRFELRDGRIATYHFIENTFDVALAFRRDGAWKLATDGTQRFVPGEGENLANAE